MTVAWFSTGISSFIALYVMKEQIDKVIYIHIDDQHEDSLRFLKDCEKLLGIEIEILQSRYKNVENTVKQIRYINGVAGAPCTRLLKKRVRKEWEADHKGEDVTYVWGMDATEAHRADRLIESEPNFKHVFPLIEKGIDKQMAHAMSNMLGLDRPEMYNLGYKNNNCIGCVKGGMGYWNKIRIDFPEVFKSRSELERLIGASCIKGVYLDELDQNRGRIEDEIIEECSIFCQLNLTD